MDKQWTATGAGAADGDKTILFWKAFSGANLEQVTPLAVFSMQSTQWESLEKSCFMQHKLFILQGNRVGQSTRLSHISAGSERQSLM